MPGARVNPTRGAAALRMRAARAALIQKFPYFAPALGRVTLVETAAVPTAAVDRHFRVYYNPEFVQGLSPRQVVGLLWHELQHPLRAHYARGERYRREPGGQERWGIAADCEINDDAARAGVELPPDGLYPEAFGLEPGQTAERYYAALRHPPPQPPSGGGEGGAGSSADGGREPAPHPQGSGVDGVERPWELGAPDAETGGIDEAEAEAVRDMVARQVLEHARERGSVPAGLERWAEGRYRPQTPWPRLLAALTRNAVRETAGRTHSTYARRNRRQAAYDPVILPGHTTFTPRVAVVVDTSGSVSDAMLAQALAEIDGVLRALAHREVRVYAADAGVHTRQRVRSVREVRLLGGGGTSMARALEEALADRPPPDVVIVLTDGFTPWPQRRPRVPVVVCLLAADAPAPPEWARVVRVEAAPAP